MKIEFYFDVACPQAYLAAARLEALEQQQGWEVDYRPVSLSGLYRIWTGQDEAPQTRYSAARRRMEQRDLMRQAETLDLYLNEEAVETPPDSVDAEWFRAQLSHESYQCGVAVRVTRAAQVVSVFFYPPLIIGTERLKEGLDLLARAVRTVIVMTASAGFAQSQAAKAGR